MQDREAPRAGAGDNVRLWTLKVNTKYVFEHTFLKMFWTAVVFLQQRFLFMVSNPLFIYPKGPKRIHLVTLVQPGGSSQLAGPAKSVC